VLEERSDYNKIETESIKKTGLDSPYIELFLPETKQQIKRKILFSIETKQI